MPTNPYSPLRWGILGAGSIANRFSSDVKPLPDHQLAAVGSRDQSKADAFADKFEIPRRYDSYEALVADPDVDVIYVATPHPFHKEHALLAIRAGKAVLLEKPFTINAAEAGIVVSEARRAGVFLMEGMWSRFFPALVKVRELIAEKAIGDLRVLQADFGFRSGVNPEGRLFSPTLAGGALMDVGVYTVSLASMVFGTPERSVSLANLGSTGVDEEAAMLLGYPGGGLAVLSTAIRLNTPHEALFLGTDGNIKVHGAWWCPRKLTVKRAGKDEETLEFPYEGGGFQFEAQHVAECLRAGKTESSVISLDETLSIMRTLDGLRAQFGLKYPME
ncbi:MAG: Gfo/Idh/MocA family oxidoreductase [Cytophagales bacterium]|nr:Gfo/Idh/MocA family oxidoreductase [Armatimonadota bacterium]